MLLLRFQLIIDQDDVGTPSGQLAAVGGGQPVALGGGASVARESEISDACDRVQYEEALAARQGIVRGAFGSLVWLGVRE
jgi:hypothetical protein